ncbi:putative Transmembrane protein [Melia azedarach]|uniref:Transmembrane protein n=1 Tax=Melia azedarach TaxID=155640 RepID=A0ACC1WXG8_MELAZ|nr:putative Transmembrane protein [Melia azedarach]
MSRPSSQFGDLDHENGDDDDTMLERLEEGDHNEEKDHKPIIPSASKREQPPKAARKKESRLSIILLDQGLFTVYKRLFVVCLTLNIVGLVLAATGHFPYARNRAGLFSVANIFALVLCRSEAILRVCLLACGENTVSYDPKTKSYSNEFDSRLIKRQEFWFTLGITVLIILPWLTVSRVPVRVSAPSGHASIIKFEGGVKAGILGRISPSPLSDWHAFGIISDGKTEHMMLVGAVGDFTKALVSNPPSHLLVRQVYFAGLPCLINMHERVLLVATGSGICVFLSFLLQPCRADMCVLWLAKGIEQSFGKEILEMMSGHPQDKVIIHAPLCLVDLMCHK